MLVEGVTELFNRVHLTDILIRWYWTQISDTPGKAADTRQAIC